MFDLEQIKKDSGYNRDKGRTGVTMYAEKSYIYQLIEEIEKLYEKDVSDDLFKALANIDSLNKELADFQETLNLIEEDHFGANTVKKQLREIKDLKSKLADAEKWGKELQSTIDETRGILIAIRTAIKVIR